MRTRTPRGSLNGTEGGTLPVLGARRSLCRLFLRRHLKRIDLDGGRVRTLTKVCNAQGGTWGPDGVILSILYSGQPGRLFRLPASGGEPVAVTKIDSGQDLTPVSVFLPGGRQFVFYWVERRRRGGVYLGALDSPDITRLTSRRCVRRLLGTPSVAGCSYTRAPWSRVGSILRVVSSSVIP